MVQAFWDYSQQFVLLMLLHHPPAAVHAAFTNLHPVN